MFFSISLSTTKMEKSIANRLFIFLILCSIENNKRGKLCNLDTYDLRRVTPCKSEAFNLVCAEDFFNKQMTHRLI